MAIFDPKKEIPGYAAALAWEAAERERSFLDLPHELCGVEVCPLTLRRLVTLITAGSPFFCGLDGPPTLAQVGVFLWALSPGYSPADDDGRTVFIARLLNGDRLDDLPACVAEIGEYLDAAFNDAPAEEVGKAGSRGGQSEPAASFVHSYVHAVAAVYHWSEDAILNLPLSRLFGYLRKIAEHLDPEVLFISRRSSRVKGDWNRSLRAAAQQAARKTAPL